MKITFHGAARTVTGSKHLITLENGKKILLDCGMFQGMGKETDPLNRNFGFEPSEIDAMILSHAHIDHSGLIPKLVKEGFKGRIYCTHPTKELATLLLEDSAEIQENDIKYTNKGRKAKGRPLLKPLYTVEDADTSVNKLTGKDYHQWFTVIDDVEAMFTDAGHIIGSACVHVRIKEKKGLKQISFSGDVGRYRDVILRAPEVFPQADVIILESTYGNRLHKSISTSVNTLLQWIEKTCLEKEGKLIIPAFSLGRTQEILYALNQLELENRLPDLTYYLDSPLSITITDVLKKYPQYFNASVQQILEKDNDPFHFKGLKYVHSVSESKEINYTNQPSVIISSSGMADAGRVKHHISNNIENSRNTILLTGYCEPSSLGGRLLAGQKEVSIFGMRHQVHAEVTSIKSMSAHGDYEDLVQWLDCQDKGRLQNIFLVHGEIEVQEAFKTHLLDKQFKNVHIPQLHQTFEIK